MNPCAFCGFPIKPGQKFKAVMRGDKLRGRYHLPCYEMNRREMGKGEEGKYGQISSSEVEFHEGEPVFLLRATDALAPHAIIGYARQCERSGCDIEHVDAAFDQAMRMSEWQRNNPEKVKALPD